MIHRDKGLLPIGALILITLGVFWLAQDMGWISTSISWWPVLLIIIGLGVLINNYWRK
ncbi:hypothetical protein COS83_00745 [archaeon CG07_land_8_20_14_0_80_38_8]|nr:MAG: hypothetical protein COS83_00745 [archaeon CG07_land_8_20_14_0_80_38_8]PIU89509.1 MAG: hypothetical protein COS64_00270 [archaeon CG06_land_8_20_14_3_00_37_11]